MTLQNILIVAALGASGSWLTGAILKRIHRRYVDPLQFPNKELAVHVRQTRIVSMDCAPDKAILSARDAVLSLPKTKVVRMAGRTLEARTGLSMRTFGENIVITAEPAGQTTRLSIESTPRYAGTTMDHGKSYENVERIFAELARMHAATLTSASAK